MASLLVISGPPGSGKSTIAAIIAARHQPSAVVAGDVFFDFLKGGAIDPWRPEAAEQNARITRIQASTAAHYRDSGFETVYDSVLGPWFVGEFLAIAGAFDYAVLMPTVEVCVDRVRTRPVHPFREETATRSLHEQFSAAHLDDRHRFDSSIEKPSDVADAIEAARSAGRLRIA